MAAKPVRTVTLKQNKIQSNILNAVRKGMTTRSQNPHSILNNVLKQNIVGRGTRNSKRKAGSSPLKEKTAKRPALATITVSIQ